MSASPKNNSLSRSYGASSSPEGRMIMAKSFEEDMRDFEKNVDKKQEQRRARSRGGSISKAKATPAQVITGFAVAPSITVEHNSGGKANEHHQRPKKPQLTKAQRREMSRKQQEAAASRKAKQGQRGANSGNSSGKGSSKGKSGNKKSKPQGNKEAVSGSKRAQGGMMLFGHLPPFAPMTDTATICRDLGIAPDEPLHPSVLKLGLQYSHGKIAGSCARSVALIVTLKQVMDSVVAPTDKPLYRALESELKRVVQFLVTCRPQSVSMGNVVNFLKSRIARCATKGEQETKEFLSECLDTYLEERIVLAGLAICAEANKKIVNGDVILTHSGSVVVEQVLIHAKAEGKLFSVIILDSNPRREGRQMMLRLVAAGIPVSYALINACSYMLSGVTKVFLGAYAMLANGNMLGRVGTAVVSMMAHDHHIPVLVCCETMKFSERVVVDSITFNELGDPADLMPDWDKHKNLNVINIMYDVTPTKFITLIVCEVGLVPPSSVPIIVREYHNK